MSGLLSEISRTPALHSFPKLITAREGLSSHVSDTCRDVLYGLELLCQARLPWCTPNIEGYEEPCRRPYKSCLGASEHAAQDLMQLHAGTGPRSAHYAAVPQRC
ncbi:hypothetical protein DOTSEDRAFT_181228 [Dothistroma septosporum NZE10]|uniref:Uncharacterized protein n=1 Tax=Dothistroma septosporum (strain NZE10 / CBS 128990) TaxID=675120 RepID=N1PCS5_DOTSN|nr:hypothetical protein DOTSEDRAFT_181228 [Dothistroma septosporum NZE10]